MKDAKVNAPDHVLSKWEQEISLSRAFGHHSQGMLLSVAMKSLLYSPFSLLSCISLCLCNSFVSACLLCVSGNLFVSLSLCCGSV